MGRPEADIKGGVGGAAAPPRKWEGLGGAGAPPENLFLLLGMGLGLKWSNEYQVTSQTQLSRPIALRHYTSWSTAFAVNNKVCDVTAAADKVLWKHFCIDTYLSWIPRCLSEKTWDPRTGDTINDYPIIMSSLDVLLYRYHVLISFFETGYRW